MLVFVCQLLLLGCCFGFLYDFRLKPLVIFINFLLSLDVFEIADFGFLNGGFLSWVRVLDDFLILKGCDVGAVTNLI